MCAAAADSSDEVSGFDPLAIPLLNPEGKRAHKRHQKNTGKRVDTRVLLRQIPSRKKPEKSERWC